MTSKSQLQRERDGYRSFSIFLFILFLISLIVICSYSYFYGLKGKDLSTCQEKVLNFTKTECREQYDKELGELHFYYKNITNIKVLSFYSLFSESISWEYELCLKAGEVRND